MQHGWRRVMTGAGMLAVLLGAMASAARADMPATRAECTTLYVTKAKSEAGARFLGMACDDLFRKISFDRYMREKGVSNGAVYTRQELTDYGVMRGVISRDEADRRHREEYDRREKVRLAKAVCVLNLPGLAAAPTDTAAQRLFRDSGCARAGN